MLLGPPLTGNQLSPVVPIRWVLPSGHTPGNHRDQRAKPVPKTTTTPTTNNNFIDVPPPTITETILLPPLPVTITATNTTCPTSTTSVATSDYLPPATSNTTTSASCAFIHHIGLIGHMRIHDSGIDRGASTSCASINTSHIHPMSSTTSTSIRPPPRLSPSGPILYSLSPHTHSTHRPGRSLANPSHRDKRTSGRSTNIPSPHPTQLSALPTHIHTTWAY
ncbi:unnamed protein product [Schistocephalus solidus]|uniref:Uncharacterized protein n=1 Tax=Schistocephalus solidus TaxID=70667 RepID=A0A183TIX0_SCHSO|nr:unnamed protein product [Schistocephalus solidus]